MNASVGFIGVGNMGTAIIKGLAAQNIQVHGCDLDTARPCSQSHRRTAWMLRPPMSYRLVRSMPPMSPVAPPKTFIDRLSGLILSFMSEENMFSRAVST